MNSLRLTTITLTTLALVSCSTFSQQKADEQPATPKETTKQATTATATPTATVTPTAEQQATAAATLQESVVAEVVATEDTLSLPTTAPTYQSTSTTSAIPGRSGLRMGRFAPPEEAASSSENAAPTPNAAELRGLRSPALPKNLPLDINGQSKSN